MPFGTAVQVLSLDGELGTVEPQRNLPAAPQRGESLWRHQARRASGSFLKTHEQVTILVLICLMT